MRNVKAPRPTLFLDRDGTLIIDRDYLKNPRQVELLPHVLPGLRRLQRAGFPMVIVTNQSGVARGLMRRGDVERVNQHVLSLLRRRGVKVLGLYWCPHAPDAGCPCRKPKLGLLKQASRELGIPWRHGISVGDKSSDVALGRKSKGKGVLVLTGYGRSSLKKMRRQKPDYIARDFMSAAKWIIKSSR